MSSKMEQAYFKHEGLSRSEIKYLLECPAKYKASMDGLLPQKDTPSLRFGSLVHLLTLQPNLFASQYIMPLCKDDGMPLNKNTNLYKEWKKNLDPSLEIVDTEDVDTATGIATAVRSNKFFKEWFANAVAIETPVYWNEDGIACKAKPDLLSEINGNRYCVDLKTTTDANPKDIGKKIEDYGYHYQASWYLRGLAEIGKPCYDFFFVFVEKTPPYLMSIVHIDADSLSAGTKLCDFALEKLRQAQATGVWTDYCEDIIEVSIPEWAKKKDGNLALVENKEAISSKSVTEFAA